MSLQARMANAKRRDKLRTERLSQTRAQMLGFADIHSAGQQQAGGGGMLLFGGAVVAFLAGVYFFTRPDEPTY